MSDDVARVVWLAEPEARDDAERALAAWARPRALSLVAPGQGHSEEGADRAVSASVTALLDEARESVSALDAAAAARALSAAEATVRAHPELPQAAWLLAEVHRAWASRWARLEPRDDTRAREAWRLAESLDGGRVPGVGERSEAPGDRGRLVAVALQGPVTRRLSVRIDGVLLSTSDRSGDAWGSAVLTGSLHHVYVDHDGQRLAAAWAVVDEAEAGARIVVTLDAGSRCEHRELSRARRDGDVVRAEGVACADWVAVAPGGPAGAISVARCHEDLCGRLLPWHVTRPSPSPSEGAPRAAASRWPGWATWAIAGVLAGAATTAGVIGSGVLEPRPESARFVGGGVRLE